MKYLVLFSLICISTVLFNACDSSTDSKSTSTNPPALVSPYDNDSNQALLTPFQWTGEAQVIWIDVNPTFPSPLSYTVSGTSYTLTTPLSPNTSYYWKAGRIVGSTTYWSTNYYHFRTVIN
ncbi:MAG: hypothetical protein ABI543_12675 [Ignavibacteria bacterium]